MYFVIAKNTYTHAFLGNCPRNIFSRLLCSHPPCSDRGMCRASGCLSVLNFISIFRSQPFFPAAAVVAGPDEDDDAVFQVERLQSERQKGSFVGSHTTMGRKDILA